MKFTADLHIHSRFSMATSSDLTLENLYISARRKGITVVGTGDFTHPEWMAEMEERLVPAEDGLYRLRPDIEAECEKSVSESCMGPVRFMLQAEISSIYKKDGRVRKNHNLVYFSSIESAKRFNARLSAIGNIKSDGRPILGLDARNLLEILLETDETGFIIPAHIWTPWFSLLGSKSGFNSIDECFGDLSPYIFAAETGLSSDPAMNWRVSFLDSISLVSNSDAHSPGKLGREANLFDTDLSYPAIRSALETGDPSAFLGTLEFFPEEGKYHLDGHRKCGVRFTPEESLKTGGICPVCGSKMTLGVLYRIDELADRNENSRPEKAKPYKSIIPLADIVAEIFKCGAGSKKVLAACDRAVRLLGPELEILYKLDPEIIKGADIPLLGTAIEKMRKNDIVLAPGYDGEFGTVKIFTDEERAAASGRSLFFDTGASENKKHQTRISETGSQDFIKKKPEAEKSGKITALRHQEKYLLNQVQKTVNQAHENLSHTQEALKQDSYRQSLNQEQLSAVNMPPCSMLIKAGPGTGKTRVITQRIARLISEEKIHPSSIAAITFTNRAAEEMKDRLVSLVKESGCELPFTGTFHSLCLKIIRKAHPDRHFGVIDQYQRDAVIRNVVSALKKNGQTIKATELSGFISESKQTVSENDKAGETGAASRAGAINENGIQKAAATSRSEALSEAFQIYQSMLEEKSLLDFDDLMHRSILLLRDNTDIRNQWHQRLHFLFIDEYQDLNSVQYDLVRLLCGKDCNVCAIGDPDQSIYGFRGGSAEYFNCFKRDFPEAVELQLVRNYRSSRTILDASFQMIRKGSDTDSTRVFSEIEGKTTLTIFSSADENREAEAVAAEIERLVGGTSHYSMYSGKSDGQEAEYAFSDFAVLFRTKAQAAAFESAFEKAGIPFQSMDSDGFKKNPGVSLVSECLAKCLDINTESSDFSSFSDLSDKSDVTDFIKAEIRNIFEKEGLTASLLKIREYLEKRCLFPESGTESGWERLLEISEYYRNNAEMFLSDLALMTDQDAYSHKCQKVSLMTLHASKGLEFPVVFITGCENDLLPYFRKGAEVCSDEERRLFFVGMTRAGERLYLSWAAERTLFGRKEKRQRSPFVDNIEEKLLEHSKKSLKKVKKDSSVKQLELF